MIKVPSDAELVREWVAFFGVPTGARVLGWAAMSAIGAPPDADRKWLLEHGIGAVSTRYRNVLALERFRDHLLAKGMTVDNGSTFAVVRAERMLVR